MCNRRNNVFGVSDNGFNNNLFGGLFGLCGCRNRFEEEVIEDDTIVLGVSDGEGDQVCYKCKRVRDEICRRNDVLGVEDRRRCNGNNVLGLEDRRHGMKRHHRR
ncbi:MAG: hypothetical protein K0S34_1644 [Bacillales bacterium]|jgi:hypothetical protein|nr:hypothetical protein [Bacillales bacterium]